MALTCDDTENCDWAISSCRMYYCATTGGLVPIPFFPWDWVVAYRLVTQVVEEVCWEAQQEIPGQVRFFNAMGSYTQTTKLSPQVVRIVQ